MQTNHALRIAVRGQRNAHRQSRVRNFDVFANRVRNFAVDHVGTATPQPPAPSRRKHFRLFRRTTPGNHPLQQLSRRPQQIQRSSPAFRNVRKEGAQHRVCFVELLAALQQFDHAIQRFNLFVLPRQVSDGVGQSRIRPLQFQPHLFQLRFPQLAGTVLVLDDKVRQHQASHRHHPQQQQQKIRALAQLVGVRLSLFQDAEFIIFHRRQLPANRGNRVFPRIDGGGPRQIRLPGRSPCDLQLLGSEQSAPNIHFQHIQTLQHARIDKHPPQSFELLRKPKKCILDNSRGPSLRRCRESPGSRPRRLPRWREPTQFGR